jgi:hypothetical protein
MLTIIAPYSVCEKTFIALRLANLWRACGHDVQYLTYQRVDRNLNLDSYWDKKVKSYLNKRAYTEIEKSQSIIYFDSAHSFNLFPSKPFEKTQNIAIVDWHTLSEEKFFKYSLFDILVFQNKLAFNFNRDIFRVAKSNVKELHCIPPITEFNLSDKKSGFINYLNPHYCFYLEREAILRSGESILFVIQELLSKLNHIHISLLHTRAWPTYLRQFLKKLSKDYSKRFTYSKVENVFHIFNQFTLADWVILPQTRAESCFITSIAFAAQTPVLCFDVEPFSSFVINNFNGIRIPTELIISEFGAPTAIFEMNKVIKIFLNNLLSENLLISLHKNQWGVREDSEYFKDDWNSVLKIA